jgi:hypothetical protein
MRTCGLALSVVSPGQPVRRVVLACALALTARVVSAQAPTTAAAQTAFDLCTPRTCTVELSPGLFSRTVRTGEDRTATWGGFAGGGIVRAVENVPDAFALARQGHRRMSIGNGLMLLSVTAMTYTLIAITGSGDPGPVEVALPLVIGAGAYAGGAPLLRSSQKRFDEAVWLYNRALQTRTRVPVPAVRP